MKNNFLILFCLTLLLSFTININDSVAASERTAISPQNRETASRYVVDELESEYFEIFRRVYNKIKNEYVEEKDSRKLLEAAIRGMISELDPHSSYLTPEEFISMRESMLNSSFSGIGAQVTLDEETGYTKVIAPIDGSPAKEAGIKAGDLFISIDNIPLKGKTLREAVDLIRGPINSIVEIKILRDEEIFDIFVTRGSIKLHTVRSNIFDPNIGYIRLSSFDNGSSSNIVAAFSSLKRLLPPHTQFRGIILDLRNNPGGLLTAAITISDMFVNLGKIVSTKGRYPDDVRISYATVHTIIPISVQVVVLIDGGSASASEIVAASLQDLYRATIIGTKSYGKGSVQSISRLPNGGGLRLTVAKYYTASGKIIHGVGVTPDIIIEIPEGYEKETPDEIDPQLQRAIDFILLGE